MRNPTMPRFAQGLLAALFLAVVFGVGILQLVLAIGDGTMPRIASVFSKMPSEAHLRELEAALDEESWIQQRVRPTMHWLRYRSLRTLGRDAILGHDGWLFFAPGVKYLVEPWPPRQTPAGFGIAVKRDDVSSSSMDAVGAIVSFRDQLAARGIELLVVPVPGKESIYPEMLAHRAANRTGPIGAHTRALMDALRAREVHVFDLFELFRAHAAGPANSPGTEPLYLATDTHWTPAGAELAAESVGAWLMAEGWVQPGDVPYEIKRVSVERHGDIVGMIRVPRIEASIPTETVECKQVVDGQGGLYQDSESAQVLVLGDSFLRIYQGDEPHAAGFLAHLARHLKQPVSSVVNDGGATTLVREVVARQPSHVAGKRVVVWEFVERDIRFGERGWEDLQLR